jgi:hypothetical protein
MTDTYNLAGEAIEEYRAEKNHNGPDGAWIILTPKTGWSLTEKGWNSAASGIVTKFNAKLPADKNITVPPSAKTNTYELFLGEWQRYLAAKADNVLSQPVIRKLEKGQ